jgi:single-stranded DNA-binding protein
MNVTVLSGRLTDTPRLKHAKNGTPWTILKIANNDCKRPVYINALVFKQQAELSCEHLEKGRMVEVQGHLEYSKDKYYQLVGDHVTFADLPDPSKRDISSDNF